MEYAIIGVIVAAALACPVMMCGPMLLRRLGLIKGDASQMSCMGMGDQRPARNSPSSAEQMRAKRAELDREIARLSAAIPADTGHAASTLGRQT